MTGNVRTVAMLGCGNMGSAFVRALAANGYQVAAWNRTYGRAEKLARGTGGVHAYRSAAEAVAAAPVVIACVSVYDVLRDVLDGAGDMTGKTLINLTTGSPEEAGEMGRWALDHGVGYLDSVITVYPRHVGNPDAQIMVSGPTRLWLEHQDTIKVLGGSAIHVSEDLSLANVLDVGVVGAFYITALTGFIEAAAYALGQGVTPEALLRSALPVIRLLEGAAEEAVEHITTGKFDVHDASVKVFAEAARAMSEEIQGKGCSAALIAEAARVITHAEGAGLADLSLASITRSMGDSVPV